MPAERKRRTPVPWDYRENPVLTTWVWETPHFMAMIMAEGLNTQRAASFSWKVMDKTAYKDNAVPLDSATGLSFKQCCDEVLTLVGKSYDRSLGYQQYAGDLATTYEVSGKRKYDFESLIGESVEVVAYDGDTTETISLRGMFDVNHYDLVLKNDDSQHRIPPSNVVDVRQEFTGKSLLDNLPQGR